MSQYLTYNVKRYLNITLNNLYIMLFIYHWIYKSLEFSHLFLWIRLVANFPFYYSLVGFDIKTVPSIYNELVFEITFLRLELCISWMFTRFQQKNSLAWCFLCERTYNYWFNIFNDYVMTQVFKTFLSQLGQTFL